ncbi:Regulatory protein RecX [compost metagenome]
MLIADNFLNEERFANAYTSGKFRIKKWGKLKIRQGLKFKQVPDKLIQKALNKIDMDEYLETLRLSAVKKSILLRGADGQKKTQQLITYLRGKGFENDLIFDVLKANNLP